PMERGHYIETSNTAYFRHDYDGEHADMRRLYEQAKIDQWNAATDIDWETPLDTDGGLIADDLVDIHGSPFWNRLSPTQRGQICRRILQDEARHMGFGMLSLPAVVAEASAAERREMEDFAVWALNRTLRGIFPLGAYEDMGFDKADIETIRQYRRDRAAGGEETAFRKFFRRDLHQGLVRNLGKVGVLSPRIAPDLQALGISLAAA